MAKKRTRAGVPVNAEPYLTEIDVEALAPADRVARLIITERRDLLPSVARIMDAELDEAARLRAIELFHDSLRTTGDPNRDPRVAITTALGPPVTR